MEWLSDFYLAVLALVCSNLLVHLTNFPQGSCGHPRYVPFSDMCTPGIYADRLIGHICAGIAYFLLATNIAVVIPLLRKRDDFGIIVVSNGHLRRLSKP